MSIGLSRSRRGAGATLQCVNFNAGNDNFASFLTACIESVTNTGAGIEVTVSVDNEPTLGGGFDPDINVEVHGGGEVEERDLHVVRDTSETRTLTVPAQAGEDIDVILKLIDITSDESQWEQWSMTTTAPSQDGGNDGDGGNGGQPPGDGGGGIDALDPRLIAAVGTALGAVGVAWSVTRDDR